jgi:chemotaxis protein MotB
MVGHDFGGAALSTVDIGAVKHEIIIVKRGHGDHDDGHHGGVWKIAFADFMTAMMCFFLVMWLINASSEQTKAAVASYFNPVKLVDRNASRKGLEDLGDGPQANGVTAETPQDNLGKGGNDGTSASGSSARQNDEKQDDKAETADQHLFADPYAVLSEIAMDTSVLQNVSEKGDGGAQDAGPGTGASGGEAYRDPFAPDFWSQQAASPDAAEASSERSRTGADDSSQTTSEMTKPSADPIPPEALAEAPIPDKKSDAPTPETVKAADEIRQQLADAFKPEDKLSGGLSVTATDKGVTISVTDQLDFGMFEIGSAVPRRELVLAMEKIGKMLSARNGALIISGHTDARPFKSGAYDNWRLSTARAHSAYYMLVRGGLDERRITEVAGFADRKLKDPSQPMSAANRRIEILLETGG